MKAVLPLFTFLSMILFSLSALSFSTQLPLDEEEILKNASSRKLGVESARVIIDNNAAFESKVDIINKTPAVVMNPDGTTRPGEIRLMYYIFADDHTSSVMAKALIAAAQRGVKVKMIVDYLTNYKHLDMFSMFEREGQGNLTVHFYNRPTRNIVRDAMFLTMPCSQAAKTTSEKTACANEKWEKIQAKLLGEEVLNPQGAKVSARDLNISNMNSGFSGLFLSGLSSKSASAIKLGLIEGAQIDLSGMSGPSDPDRTKKMKEFLSLIFKAKVGGDVMSQVKLALAFQLYGEDVIPAYNLISGIIPLDHTEAVKADATTTAGKDWEHLTDFLHHKILVADAPGGKTSLQLGGRNVENSYHMNPKTGLEKEEKLTEKYIFNDTDMRVSIRKGGNGEDIIHSYDRLFNFQTMVASIPEIRSFAPNDMLTNIGLTASAIETCKANSKHLTGSEHYLECINRRFKDAKPKTLATRMDEAKKNMNDKAARFADYKAKYIDGSPLITWKGTGDDSLSENDIKNSLIVYIENLPFNKALPVGSEKRTYGSRIGEEAAHGKYIHSLWVKALESSCQSEEEKTILLNQAYLFAPANLMNTLGKMANQTWDCSNVTAHVITNSFATTDLNVINILARYQSLAFSERIKASGGEKSAKFNYYEMQNPENVGSTVSLHTKLSVIGDNVILGSANADVRSYMMDSNNGLFIHGAKDFSKQYTEYILSQKETGTDRAAKYNMVDQSQDYKSGTIKIFGEEDNQLVDAILKRFGWDKKRTQEQQVMIKEQLKSFTSAVYKSSQKAFTPRSDRTDHEGQIEANAEDNERREDGNSFDRAFKAF